MDTVQKHNICIRNVVFWILITYAEQIGLAMKL
jgi:hypothetical protein